MRARVRSSWWPVALAVVGLACSDEASGPPRVINLATTAAAPSAPAQVDPAGAGNATPDPTADDDQEPPPGAGDGEREAGDARLLVRGGDLSPETVEQTVAQAAPALQRCTSAARSKQPELRGTLVLAFKVKNTGQVAWAKAVPTSTVQNTQLERCVVALLKRLRFGKFKGGAAFVTYPLAVE